jgi:hypothetical protein
VGALGPVGNHTHTVFSRVRRLALHEAEHCGEIEAEVKRARK